MNTLRLHEPGQPASDRAREDFRHDLRAGLRRVPRTIPCKYLYDDRGQELFAALCAQPEYYLMRTEHDILSGHAQQIADLAGPGVALVDFGSGESREARVLLDHLARPAAYVPLDISTGALEQAMRTFHRRYRSLPVIPICTDFTRIGWQLPVRAAVAARRLFFFPGSSFGALDPGDAVRFLRHLRHKGVPGDVIVVGIDLLKDVHRLEAAYNDRAGITAAFNLNMLERANRELWCDFSIPHFRHRAVFNRDRARIEMGLVSRLDHQVHLDDESFRLTEGEVLTTKYAYKYDLDRLPGLAREGGLLPAATWTDPQRLFAVACFRLAEPENTGRS